ncbi:zinc finger MYM-type protein 1-like isoform X1 [Anthonomus grandis grandis]|uniref:zinc finger MYM-type protein 1-like isoform X1 n=1 Tax=Anthonomus grandis grandis TaxID=2921223 RepID=UPI0021653DD3|nr:zinc finger MYM-type protein 1-like isoform X1 [Anthonomus grandis grandis]XP_050299137.1 zinc finger MYM-type protein 1-like isoform X1 [Anthonomus grandis grandis]
MGFIELEKMDAETISGEINKFINILNIDVNKFVGQGYDGCATMAGKDGGVQKILRETYKKGLYFHCASHKLNLVVNDLNKVPEIRNCIGTVKDTINFFRESVLRRKYAPKIPLLCETRWSQKYKSIALFKTHFIEIVKGLEQLSQEGNSGTRTAAFQLLSAVGQTSFILSLCIIDKYNSLLEPVANILQSKTLDIIKCSDHIKTIKTAVIEHRLSAEEGSEELLKTANEIAEALDIQLLIPRTIGRQIYRANHPAASLSEYFRRSLYVPYLDSLLSSLEARFSQDQSPAFALSLLHPAQITKIAAAELKIRMEEVSKFYELEGIMSEAQLWQIY